MRFIKLLVATMIVPTFMLSITILALAARLAIWVAAIVVTIIYRIRHGEWPEQQHADHPYN